MHLGRHSQTQQNFSYYHTKLVFDLLSYSFHPKIEHREETGGVNVQEMLHLILARQLFTRCDLIPDP